MKLLDRKQMAWRAAQDIADGMYVNLGLGMPMTAANYTPRDRDVFYQTENGILGLGPSATTETKDLDLVAPGGTFVTLREGAALFTSVDAFAMMRGGHLDLTLLGGYQVSASGDLANWDTVGSDRAPLIGGAMDLAVGAKQVWVIMDHTTRDGEPRLVKICTYPLTATGTVNRVYTNMAVVDVTAEGFVAREIIDGMSVADLQAATGAPIVATSNCRVLTAPTIA
ncbi:3-oxoacid CoA-transferase subunit B [Bradyrhizobium sp. LHD-71]|uniref:3-oxoacid CoA-transferase subunit B n=1 Tax=Bradyrhizobium sp. LHD-71 TaxID=3072141 RepID=UPI00280C8797|nr:3-oxoacid CoA-transferase subunit B [Bradyrhizobium sp. LHD-71]MDQ8730862.1 3-oxoacid CoA-transferase subunit B [Bradyrhizobium sp. LHD-71]